MSGVWCPAVHAPVPPVVCRAKPDLDCGLGLQAATQAPGSPSPACATSDVTYRVHACESAVCGCMELEAHSCVGQQTRLPPYVTSVQLLLNVHPDEVALMLAVGLCTHLSAS